MATTTSKLRVIAGAAIIVAGCAGRDDQQVTATTNAALESAPTGVDEALQPPIESAEVYVTLESPREDCPALVSAPCSGGYLVREVNRDGRMRTVSRFVSELERGALEQAGGAGKGELLLRGHFGPAERRTSSAPFTILGAWRGLPGVEPSPLDRYVAVDSNGDRLEARLLNRGGEHPIGSVSVAGCAPRLVDPTWLTARVLGHGAIVAGRLDDGILEAGQVFIRLPDYPGPCPGLRMLCGDRTATYERDANHCLEPTGCVERHFCPLFLPECDPGYRLVSWASQPNGCAAFACDPAFLTQ